MSSTSSSTSSSSSPTYHRINQLFVQIKTVLQHHFSTIFSSELIQILSSTIIEKYRIDLEKSEDGEINSDTQLKNISSTSTTDSDSDSDSHKSVSVSVPLDLFHSTQETGIFNLVRQFTRQLIQDIENNPQLKEQITKQQVTPQQLVEMDTQVSSHTTYSNIQHNARHPSLITRSLHRKRSRLIGYIQ